MKKSLFTLMMFVSTFLTYAQEEMSQVWTSDLGHKMMFTGTGLEGEVSYAANEKEITVFSNEDGKIIWTKTYKELAPKLRKIDELIPFWESDCIFLFDKKAGADQIAVIDLHSGQLLWNTNKYQDLSRDNIVYIAEEDGFAISLKKSLVLSRRKPEKSVGKPINLKVW